MLIKQQLFAESPIDPFMHSSSHSSINKSIIKNFKNNSFQALSPHFQAGPTKRYQSKDNDKCYKFWKTFLILTTLHCVLFEVDCSAPLDESGLFYTQQLQIVNSPVNGSYSKILSINSPYSGWSFTNSVIPGYYVSLSIQQINIQVDISNNYLTFNITSKTVSQTSILIYLGVCQFDGSCFISVTIRMLAVDYDMSINSALCSQVKNNFFIQSQTVNGALSYSSWIYQYPGYQTHALNDTLVTFNSTVTIFVYINSFRFYKNMSLSQYYPAGIYNSYAYYKNSSYFRISFIVYSQSPSSYAYSVTFSAIILRSALFSSPSSPSYIYKIIVSSSSYLNRARTISANYSSLTGYPYGQDLVYGMNGVLIYSNKFINITTTIGSARVFATTSANIFNTNVYDIIYVRWFIIQKQVCLYPNRYLVIDNNATYGINGSSYCSSSICGDGYYTENQYTCYQCLNPLCKTCQSSSNLSCLSKSCINGTFFLNFNCYYICPPGYYNDEITGNCQICQINCLNCSMFTNCYECENQTFLYNNACLQASQCPYSTYADTSHNQCSSCSGYCLSCQSQGNNCTSCTNTTFYLNFNCYQTCPPSYFEEETTGSCKICLHNCLICNSSAICSQCQGGFFLYPEFDSCQKQCPFNYFPNNSTGNCQTIIIFGCNSALFIKNSSVCLQCDFAFNFKFDPKSKSCVCKTGYKLQNSSCTSQCGDGIIISSSQQCDDHNLRKQDGCSTVCKIQNYFSCAKISNGPFFTSQCTYLPDINFQILSETKVSGQNTLKLILKISPSPGSLTADQIKQFLNIKISNMTVNMSAVHIIYQNGIAQLFIPYYQDIQGSELLLQTNFNSLKYNSKKTQMSFILQSDNTALLYSTNWPMLKNLATFNFYLAILVCVMAVVSFYKHKMIGLELILPFQVIFYSQSFYLTKSISESIFTAFKPVSFSVLTPSQVESKANVWYNIGMTGGFLLNYNLLGMFFAVSTVLLLVSVLRLHFGQKDRFQNNKIMRDWIKFTEFRFIIQKHEAVVWKGFFTFLCLSIIPLIFAISSRAMTQNYSIATYSTFDIINEKSSIFFTLLFLLGLIYTSIPGIFYNNSKDILKRHIFMQDCQKFKYKAKYCVYFVLHYLVIGLVFALCQPNMIVMCILSANNGLFMLYLVIKRPYQSIIDNIGAILSNFICCSFFSVNLYITLTVNKNLDQTFMILFCLAVIVSLTISCFISIARYIIFYRIDKAEQSEQRQNKKKDKIQFNYVRDEAFHRFVNLTKQQEQQAITKKLTKSSKPLQFNLQQIIGSLNINKSEENSYKQHHKTVFQSQTIKGKIYKQEDPNIESQKQELKKRLRKSLMNSRMNAMKK